VDSVRREPFIKKILLERAVRYGMEVCRKKRKGGAPFVYTREPAGADYVQSFITKKERCGDRRRPVRGRRRKQE